MFKKLNKKGFTLAELLVVVAIIGVLVAISIPIFTSQLEKAREATDLANLRAAYAECSAAVLTGETVDNSATGGVKCGLSTTAGKEGNYVATKVVKLKQKQTKWQTGAVEVGGITLGADKLTALTDVTVTVTDDGSAPTFKQGNTDLKATN